MERFIEKNGKRLRLGYTTGTCAAAAAKAAATMLLTGNTVDSVNIVTPNGVTLNLEINEISFSAQSVLCAVKKDSGDDPDITNGLLIFARVSKKEMPGVIIEGGVGVGRITAPGLDQPVGAAAINSVPRHMIERELVSVCMQNQYQGGLFAEIFVPDGEKIAEKTFNPRMGIKGGISILGTTGIVEPMSEKALIDTIQLELRRKRAEGKEYALLTPGNYGADYIKHAVCHDESVPVLVSNYIGDAIDSCCLYEFKGILLVGHIGKLVKLAGGMFNTHSKYGDCRMEIIASHAAAEGMGTESVRRILECVTCDEAIRILEKERLKELVLERLITAAERNIMRRMRQGTEAGIIVFSKYFGLLCKTENADRLAERIGKE